MASHNSCANVAVIATVKVDVCIESLARETLSPAWFDGLGNLFTKHHLHNDIRCSTTWLPCIHSIRREYNTETNNVKLGSPCSKALSPEGLSLLWRAKPNTHAQLKHTSHQHTNAANMLIGDIHCLHIVVKFNNRDTSVQCASTKLRRTTIALNWVWGSLIRLWLGSGWCGAGEDRTPWRARLTNKASIAQDKTATYNSISSIMQFTLVEWQVLSIWWSSCHHHTILSWGLVGKGNLPCIHAHWTKCVVDKIGITKAMICSIELHYRLCVAYAWASCDRARFK